MNTITLGSILAEKNKRNSFFENDNIDKIIGICVDEFFDPSEIKYEANFVNTKRCLEIFVKRDFIWKDIDEPVLERHPNNSMRYTKSKIFCICDFYKLEYEMSDEKNISILEYKENILIENEKF